MLQFELCGILIELLDWILRILKEFLVEAAFFITVFAVMRVT